MLAAIYMLWAFQRTFQGPSANGIEGMRDCRRARSRRSVPVVAAMLVLGVYPKLVLDRIDPSSESVVALGRDSVEIDQASVPGGLRAAGVRSASDQAPEPAGGSLAEATA